MRSLIVSPKSSESLGGGGRIREGKHAWFVGAGLTPNPKKTRGTTYSTIWVDVGGTPFTFFNQISKACGRSQIQGECSPSEISRSRFLIYISSL